jgi:hypothetical protein
MVELCGLALFALGVNRVRTAADVPSAHVGLLSVAIGIVIMALGYVLPAFV